MKTSSCCKPFLSALAAAAALAVSAAPQWSVTPIQDRPMTMPGSLFHSIDPRENVRPADAYPASLNVFLIRDEKGGNCALVDAGYGRPDSLLPGELAKLGIKPEEIAAVFITHIHPDHVGGLTAANGKAAFPNAKVFIARKEYEAWQNDPARAALARHLTPVRDNIVLIDYGVPVAPYGLVPLCFPGHTPGHTVFQLRLTRGEKTEDIYFVGDIVHAAMLQIPAPGFCARFDMDPETAVRSRRYLLENAPLWYGAHLPFPGIVRIVRGETACGFAPEAE